ncbi:MAG TPA: FAD-dependent oxidoreductase [Hyphomonas sp.]|nr:FAD-dependent oxidoreductase [Hyphomonas sp.]MCB9969975.1 FAD-dependent oxidoreductase [Hyphomonas sp.]HPE48630.1 FAD-dependent oxidoreductase [Hyphomonas sp.]
MSLAHRPPAASAPRVAILGAGIIGLAAAFELAVRRGVPVTVYDPAPFGRGASWAAAGMLAPAFEAAAETGAHPHLFELCHHGAELWPAFAADVGAASGTPLGFSAGPSLALAFDRDQTAALHHLARALDERGIAHEELRPGAAHELEPAIAPDLVAALHLPTDGQVDNRAVVSALIAALRACPHAALVNEAAPLADEGNGLTVPGHDLILAAAGWKTAAIEVRQDGELYSLVNWDTSLDEIDCYGGQMLSVGVGPDMPAMTLRCGGIYVAPKAERVIIGATMEPGIATEAPEPDKIAALRADAARLCPAIADAPELETWAGIRPGTPDRAPLIGATAAPGLYVAAGHYRNGILLAPITAHIIADLILGQPVHALAGEFSPHRSYSPVA